MELSPDERRAGKLNEDHLKHALRSLRECGYVVMERALSPEWVGEMRAAFEAEHRRQGEGAEERIRNAGGHYGIPAPLRMPFLDSLAVANPLALQVMEEAMGPGIFTCLPYGSNTSWPGSGVQHIHRDTGQLFPEAPYVLPVSIAVVNIPLSDGCGSKFCNEPERPAPPRRSERAGEPEAALGLQKDEPHPCPTSLWRTAPRRCGPGLT